MDPRVFPMLAAVGTIAAILHLLRRRRLREKYVVLWLVVAVAVAVVAVFPVVLAGAAQLVGVQTPANLLFFVAALVLLVVCVQLSAEVSGLEEETRSIAEEMALLRLLVEEQALSPPKVGPEDRRQRSNQTIPQSRSTDD